MPESLERSALTEAVYYILLSLYKEPRHGYAMMQEISGMTGGRVNLGPGTLYGALNTLEEKGWICAMGSGVGNRKKEYMLTTAGAAVLAGELERLAELVQAGIQIVKGGAE